MKEEIYDDLFEEKEEKTNWQAMLFKYIIRWYLVHRLCYFLSGMRLALFEDHYSRVQHKCVHDYQGQ